MPAGPRRHHFHSHSLHAGCQLHARLAHHLIRVPCAGVRHRQQARLVRAIHTDAELPARADAGHARFQRVGSTGIHVDRVFQPLPGRRPAHHMVVARRRVARDIHPFVSAVLSALVRHCGIVIGDTFSAGVEVFDFDRARQQPGRPRGIGRLHHRRIDHRLEPIKRAHVAAGPLRLHHHAHRAQARSQLHPRLAHHLVRIPCTRVRHRQ